MAAAILHEAVLTNDATAVAAALATVGCDAVTVNAFNEKGDTPLHSAVRRGNTYVLAPLLAAPGLDLRRRNARGFSALHVAAHTCPAALDPLLDAYRRHGLDVNERAGVGNMTALHIAAGISAPATAALLAQPDVDVNAVANDRKNAAHMAAIQCAASMQVLLSNERTRRLLKERDACGCTPLHMTVLCCNVAAAALLLAQPEVDVGAAQRDCSGRTLLHLAAIQGNKAIVQAVLDARGADVRIRDNNDKTAYDMCTDPEVRRLLRPPQCRRLRAYIDDAAECSVCLCNDGTDATGFRCVFIPCGHWMCPGCMAEHEARTAIACPVCRGRIEDVMEVPTAPAARPRKRPANDSP